MSLVDYASSDEDEAEAREQQRERFEVPKDEPEVPKRDQLPPQNQKSGLSSNEQPGSSSEPSVVKLPDASVLLNSTYTSSHLGSGCDHSSRVAAAMAECASRKREADGVASALPRSKVPKGNLPHSRSVPDTESSLLVPPQLRGRSNVVTEDMGKLFVQKRADPHITSSQNRVWLGRSFDAGQITSGFLWSSFER